jgi:hypothetical protein
MGHNKAIWTIAHRLCRTLYEGVRYIEYGGRDNPAANCATSRLLRSLKALGYPAQLIALPHPVGLP